MCLIKALKDLKYSREVVFIEAVWNMIWAIIKMYLSSADNQSVLQWKKMSFKLQLYLYVSLKQKF